jgi:hypothetical protein
MINRKRRKTLCYERGGHLLIHRCFDVNKKKGRCFSPLAQKTRSVGFVHSKANNSGIKGKSNIARYSYIFKKFFTFNPSFSLNTMFFLYKEALKVFFQSSAKERKNFQSFFQVVRVSFGSSLFANITLKTIRKRC